MMNNNNGNNPNGFGGLGQGNIGPGGYQFPYSTQRFVVVNGQKIPVGGEYRELDSSGRPVLKQIVGAYQQDLAGRPRVAADYRGRSWSGYPLYVDRFFDCQNSFKLHQHDRVCSVGDDGFFTGRATEGYGLDDHGRLVPGYTLNFLCTECFEHNEKLKRRRFWFWWLGYLSEVY